MRKRDRDRMVRQFNDKFPVGIMVKAYRGVVGDEDTATIGRVRETAFVLGGHTPVTWVEGVAGCIALKHIVAVEDGGEQ